MARVEILVTINDGCDPCWNSKEKVARKSVTSLTWGETTWYFCEEHEEKFRPYFIKTFGEGEVSE